MSRRPGLGKGLDALIPSSDSAVPASGIDTLPVASISPNPKQPRSTFNQEELAELANSIREHGVIQPLVVAKAPQPDQYLLIAGERRLQAARLAGLAKVPAIVRDVTGQRGDIIKRLEDLVNKAPDKLYCHDIKIYQEGGKFTVFLHCALQANFATEKLEKVSKTISPTRLAAWGAA